MNVRWYTRKALDESILTFIVPVNSVLDIGSGIRPQHLIKPQVHICCDPFKPYLEQIVAGHPLSGKDDQSTYLFVPQWLGRMFAFLPGKSLIWNYLMNSFKSLDSNCTYLLVHADWAWILKVVPRKSVDSVFLLDVIEHLDKNEGIRLLRETETIARKQIIIFTPLGFMPQNHSDEKDAWGLEGGRFQDHKSGWTINDFDKSWEIHACKEYHVINNLGKKLSKPHGAFWAIKNLSL